jgi:hypothetical protein
MRQRLTGVDLLDQAGELFPQNPEVLRIPRPGGEPHVQMRPLQVQHPNHLEVG